jgi:hypothetical protein
MHCRYHVAEGYLAQSRHRRFLLDGVVGERERRRERESIYPNADIMLLIIIIIIIRLFVWRTTSTQWSSRRTLPKHIKQSYSIHCKNNNTLKQINKQRLQTKLKQCVSVMWEKKGGDGTEGRVQFDFVNKWVFRLERNVSVEFE